MRKKERERELEKSRFRHLFEPLHTQHTILNISGNRTMPGLVYWGQLTPNIFEIQKKHFEKCVQ